MWKHSYLWEDIVEEAAEAIAATYSLIPPEMAALFFI